MVNHRTVASAWVVAIALCATPLRAEEHAPYVAAAQVEGTVRISGSPQDAALFDALEAGFGTAQPGVRFTRWLHGHESTLAAVYTGTADVAVLARELREPMERMAFEWVLLDKPMQIEIANAGLASDRLSTQLAVFVHKDNPLGRITLQQLDGILGAEHLRGGKNLRAWGDVGLDADWRTRSIEVIGPQVDGIDALYVRRQVLQDSRKWNPGYREIDGDGAVLVAALAATPAGIAVAPLRAANASVKPLALATDATGPFVLPDDTSITARTYPLVRRIVAVTARTKEKPMPAATREFLRYVLSRDGQAAIADEGGYLPLSPADARAALLVLQ